MYVHVFVCVALASVAGLALGYDYNPNYLVPSNCKACDSISCPQLRYCAGKKVKDNCGCCERCSSNLFQPHAAADAAGAKDEPATESEIPQKNASVDACQERQCPKFKVCIINIQGLPICTCPSKFVCDPKRAKKAKKPDKNGDTTICGSDGITYESRCHMRVANCEKGRRIRRKHSGACLLDQQQRLPQEDTKSGAVIPDASISAEDRERLKAIEKVKRRRQKRKKLKEKRKRKKERKLKKNRDKRRRMKRRNRHGFNEYSHRYDKLIGRYTKWGRSQIRKSRI